jgi:ribosomal-protein-alanine N-acetyltransferase
VTVLATQRLTLRHLGWQDAGFIVQLLNEDGFLRYIGDKGVRTLTDAREYIDNGPVDSYRRHGFGLYLTSLHEGTPLGICGLVKRDSLTDVDVGFAFLSQHWGKGYATESASAVLDYGRSTLRLGRIVAITAPDNHGSMAVLAKIGLKLERRLNLATGGPEVNLFGPAAGIWQG